ncbi:unnamed protein product, partial [Symbiodinium sp. KB8]
MGPYKGTRDALKNGVQLRAALADVKNKVSTKPAKWKPPSIPLNTEVGVGGLTLKTLMASEKLTYEEAVTVYLAFQETKRTSKPSSPASTKGAEPESPGEKNQVTPKARPSRAKQASEEPPKSKRGRSLEARTAEPRPKSKRGKTTEAEAAEPSPEATKPTPKSKRGKTAEAQVAEPSPEAAEPTPKSKRGKTAEADVAEPVPKLKRGRAHSDLSTHDSEAVPARRVMRKSSPAPQALPSIPEPAEPAQPTSDDWDWSAGDGDGDEDDIWCEYELWRQGLPQLSELEVRDYLPGFSSQASVSAGQPRILNGVNIKTQAAPVPRPSLAAIGAESLGGDEIAEDDTRVNSQNKVQHIIATQVGERDEQAPDSLEDTLYWVVVQRLNQDLSANCKPGTAFFDAPIPGADPGLLSKKAPATQSAPLKADVLTAHDRMKESMSQIAAHASSNTGKEVKKNINSISDLLMDFGQVQSLLLCKGQAKGYMKELSKRALKSATSVADVLDQKLLEMAMDLDYWMDTAAGLYERTADLGKCRTDSKASRNIMYSLLVQSYLMRGKTNVTLQTLNSAIVADFNKLSQEGVQVGDEVYYFIPVGFRGDLKQMCQAFNLTRKPGAELVQ